MFEKLKENINFENVLRDARCWLVLVNQVNYLIEYVWR